MTTKIDSIEFEVRKGVIETMTRPVTVYTSPLTEGVGAQVFGERGEPFTIALTKYADATQLEIVKQAIRGKLGRVVQLSSDGIIYLLPQWGGFRFLVEAVEIVSADVIPMACGVRSTGSYYHAPASRVVSRMTLRAVR